MGEQGSVAWMFERKSQIYVSGEKASEDQLMNVALEAGGDDLRQDGEAWEILSAPEAHEAVQKALEVAGIPILEASIAMVPMAAFLTSHRPPCCRLRARKIAAIPRLPMSSGPMVIPPGRTCRSFGVVWCSTY